MDKQRKLKTEVLAKTLRLMANKIENGFPITEEQEDMIVKLSRDIVLLHPMDYERPNSIIENEEDIEK